MKQPEDEALLRFFKALADASRLKIVSLLARNSYSVEELAGMLNLGASTVSHHLSRLAEVGLVSARAQGYYNFYTLEKDILKQKIEGLLSDDLFPQVANQVDPLDYDRKVIRGYLQADGRLKAIPSQRKKREVILRWIAREFAPGEEYTEKQVNEILGKYHEDTALLRRELVGYQLLNRDAAGRVYWRVGPTATDAVSG